MNIEKLDNKRLNKALEMCGIYKVKIIDKTHGFLYIDINKRNIDKVGKRWFVCASSEQKPDVYSTKLSPDLFGKVLLASWNRYTSAVLDDNEEGLLATETEHEEQSQAAVQPTVSPPQPRAKATTRHSNTNNRVTNS